MRDAAVSQAYPKGAVVKIDKKARQQIDNLEKGINPTSSNFRDALREGILKAVDNTAATLV